MQERLQQVKQRSLARDLATGRSSSYAMGDSGATGYALTDAEDMRLGWALNELAELRCSGKVSDALAHHIEMMLRRNPTSAVAQAMLRSQAATQRLGQAAAAASPRLTRTGGRPTAKGIRAAALGGRLPRPGSVGPAGSQPRAGLGQRLPGRGR